MKLPISAETEGVVRVIRCPKLISTAAIGGISAVRKRSFVRDGVTYWQAIIDNRGSSAHSQFVGCVMEYRDHYLSANRRALYVLETPFNGYPWSKEEW